ncbi:hypothetical protein ACFQH6_07510 [Halobacteriaceae archaeon GCM10025711]
MRPRTRRALLHAGTVGLAGLFAGCIAGSTDGTVDKTTTDTSTTDTTTRAVDDPLQVGDARTVGDVTVTVTGATVTDSFFYLTTPDSMAVAGDADARYLFVDVAANGDAPESRDFHLVTGDDGIPGTVKPTVDGRDVHVYDHGPAYTRDEDGGEGWFVFRVPVPLSVTPAVRWDVGDEDPTWQLPDDVTVALAGPAPRFELVSFDVPASVSADEPIPVSLTIRNAGEGDGTFRAVLNEAGPMYAPHSATAPVPAGEKRTLEWSIDTHVGSSADRVGLALRSPVADRDVAVSVSAGD